MLPLHSVATAVDRGGIVSTVRSILNGKETIMCHEIFQQKPDAISPVLLPKPSIGRSAVASR